jgi:PIN domain nuclease of toxin-antitoxin system
VTDAILLDTHIALWLDSGSDWLRSSTRGLIDGLWRNGGTVFLSAVTAREIARLVDTGRIKLDGPVEAWFARLLDRPGIAAVPLGRRAACRSNLLHHLPHPEPAGDPADRLLIATAIELGCPLVTYDERIVRFGEAHGRQFGFATEA